MIITRIDKQDEKLDAILDACKELIKTAGEILKYMDDKAKKEKAGKF